MAAKKTIKRISLSGGKKTVSEASPTKSSVSSQPKKRSINVLSILTAPWRYVVNSWLELRQVRWPNRSATWSLTLAVILFTVFFAVVILILDGIFQFIFKEVLLK